MKSAWTLLYVYFQNICDVLISESSVYTPVVPKRWLEMFCNMSVEM